MNGPKLRTYVLFKEMYCTEYYVKYCMSRQQRSLIAQLRLGILPIHIETGRFRGTQLDDRICQLYDTQEDEDEIHFVCKCKLYNDLRKTMYTTVEHKHTDFYMYHNKDKFIFLVQKEWKIQDNCPVEAWSEHTRKLYIQHDHVHFLFNACQNQTNTITCVSHVNFTYVSKVIF